MTAIRRVLRLMRPLTAGAGRNWLAPGGVLSISTFIAFVLSALSAEAFIIIIPIPTVQISSLTHYYDTSAVLADEVSFPCGSGTGTCSSSGFSAAIAHGDEIIMTFAAPPGMRFHVFYNRAFSAESLGVEAQWLAPGSDSVSMNSYAAVNFENLTGTKPTEIENQFAVGDAGVLVRGFWEGDVTGDFTFTALTFTFPVNNSPPGATAFFGPVGIVFVHDLGFSILGAGSPGTPDQILMQVEPLPDTDGDGIPDLTDNCPFTPNGPLLGTCINLSSTLGPEITCTSNAQCAGYCSMNQEDTGGVGTGSPPDGIGDACQCGDVNNDGIVNNIDATHLKHAVAGIAPYPGGVTTLPGYNKCQVVNGAPGLTCNNSQATIIQRAVAGLSPGIKQGCHAATIFP